MNTTSDPVVVSVIVPCHNAARHLERLLASVSNQELAESAEVILVDNGSTDDSAAVAMQVSGCVPIRVLDVPSPLNASFARNEGVKSARGDKLFFVDADDELAPGYLSAMSDALETHTFVTSVVDSKSLNSPWVRGAHGDPWQAESIGVFFDFLPGTGVNVGLRRALFDEIGGFPVDFSGSQDVAFCWRAQLAGHALHLVPEACYRYRYRDSLVGLFRQARNWGTSNVRLYCEFAEAGMPKRPLAAAGREWRESILGLVRAKGRAEAAPFVVRVGYCVGKLVGSVRYRTLYF